MSAARLLFVGLLLTTATYAQSVASLQILSDTSQLLVGRTMRLRAVARDAGGNLLPNAVINWTTNNATAAAINSNGDLSAKALAVVRVQARSGNASAETAIQFIPSRVAISPESATVNVFDTLQFKATAFDADDNPIPNVSWTWSVTNLRQGTSQTARVTSAGLMSALAEGSNFVWATYNYSDVQTGLQRQWVVNAKVDTSVPKSYTLRRLFNNASQLRTGFKLRARQSMLWSTDAGDLYLNASLDGLSGGLLRWSNGAFQMVTTAGLPRFISGSFATEMSIHSIARNGRILAAEDTNINGRQISLGDKDGVIPFFSNNTPLTLTEATSGIVTSRNSYTSGGQMLLRANFRFADNPINYVGLFRGYNNRITELLVSTQETIPELGTTGTFNVDGDFGIADDGTAYYSLTLGANRIYYKHPPSADRTRLIGIGDTFAGSTVRTFPGGRGNHPTFWVDESGAVLLCVQANNNNLYYVYFDKDGKSQTLQLSGQTGILWFHPNYGALLHANPFNNKGNGAWLWKPGSDPKSYFLYAKPTLAGTTVEDIESGTIAGDGTMYLNVRTSSVNMGIVRIDPDPGYVMYSDMDVPVTAPVNLITLLFGGRQGPPHALTGGTTGSITEFNGTDWTPRLAIGERIFGSMWYGAGIGNTSSMRKAPNGDIYVIVPAGIARITPGANPELLVRFPLRDGTLTINNPGQLEVNANGDILFNSSTSAGDSRFYIWSNNNLSLVLTYSGTAASAMTIDNRIASGFDHFAITDDGKVLASLRFRNLSIPVLYVWESQKWTRTAEPNLTSIGNNRVTGITSLYRSGSGRIYAALTSQTGGNFLCEWKGDQWATLVDVSSVMLNGQVANSVSLLDANRRGDLLFQQSNGNNFLLVRPADAKANTDFKQVINFFRPTAEGDYLVRLTAIDFRDDGTVYFLAINQNDETVLYQAQPN